jgi:ABC-type nickel/cobalt efflux system permease component RcnA
VKRLALLVLVAGAAVAGLCIPGHASAHPLGNFTVNHFAAIELAGDGVYVRFSLDLAEVPTFQLGDGIRAAGYASEAAESLVLTIDGRRVPLRVVAHRAVERPGAAGLKTLRFDAVYRADATGTRLTFADRTFTSRIGWREIVVTARGGATVITSSVPAVSRSDELRGYGADLLRSPLDVRSATVTYRPGAGPAVAPQIVAAAAPAPASRGFESLIERGDLSFGVVLMSLLVAAFWGAAHALTPGHGKALVAGYLVGTKGRPRHAFLLGATVTVTHTAGVFALGLATLVLSRFVVPEQLYPWLTLASGLLVVGVGLSVLWRRTRAGGWPGHRHHAHSHHHAHEGHGQRHHHHHHDALTTRGIVGVGVAAGLLPCPSALVVLLSAIALHRLGLGFALIAAFSFGLAATITCIGLVAVFARSAFGRLSLEGRIVRALPSLSAAAIVAVGLGLTLKALPGVV